MIDPEMMAALMEESEPLPLEPPTLHKVKLARKFKRGHARVEAVPPEEFSVSRSAKLGAMQAVDYCAHTTRKPEYVLIDEFGFDEDTIATLPDSDFDDEEEAQARDTVSDRTDGTGASNLNRSNRLIEVTEHYTRLKYDDDGKVRLYRITTAGESGTILRRDGKPAIDRIDEVPFATITPFPMTHRFFGRSLADHVMDLQRIKTAIVRALLDNMYLANNGRTEVSAEHAGKHTIDDLLTNRPGGIVRTLRPGGLIPIPNSEIGSFGYPLLEYWDKEREVRTGVSRQGQGLGSDSLKNVGQEVLLSMFNMAQAKMRLIARIFAETGIRDMFLLLHAITRREATKADTVRLRGQWVEIDPNAWRRRDDMTVSVGLGSGSKPQQIAFLSSLLGLQQEAMQFPELGLVKPKHLYNTIKRMVEANGFKSADPFVDNPDDAPPMPPGPEPEDPAMMEVQARLALEAEQSQTGAQIEAERVQLEHTARLREIEVDAQLRREQMMLEAQLRREQMEKEAQTNIGTAVVGEVVHASQSAEVPPPPAARPPDGMDGPLA